VLQASPKPSSDESSYKPANESSASSQCASTTCSDRLPFGCLRNIASSHSHIYCQCNIAESIQNTGGSIILGFVFPAFCAAAPTTGSSTGAHGSSRKVAPSSAKQSQIPNRSLLTTSEVPKKWNSKNLYIAAEAFESKTGADLYEQLPKRDGASEPTGDAWDEDSDALKSRFPLLWAKYG